MTPPDQLQTVTIPARTLGAADTATQANSTTLADIQRKQRNAKAVIGVLSTLAMVAMFFMQLAPWNLLVGAVLFIAAVVVAYFTNALSPAELDALIAKLSDAAGKVSFPSAPKPPTP